MAKLPYFPFYPADWLACPRNNCLTLAQQGAYIRLLSLCWMSSTCSLPDNLETLKKLSGLDEQMLPDVYQMFISHSSIEDAITNKRLLQEWEKANKVSMRRSQAGKKPREKRANNCLTNAKQMPNKCRTNAKQMPTYSESESESESELSSSSEPQSSSEKNKKKEILPAMLSASGRVWTRYSEAYKARYKTDPVRNAKVNGQISQLIKRIGEEAAPEVAGFYVWHNDQYYVRSRHPPGLLLRDAEGLHTQWKTGQTVTTTRARQQDQQATKGDMWREIAEEIAQERNTINVEPNR